LVSITQKLSRHS